MGNKILLFIPAYNCEKQISRVIGQINGEIASYIDTVIVVDNGSQDHTRAEAAKALQNIQKKHFVLLNNQNYGLGGSHKMAFEFAQTNAFDYVIVLHGDDQAALVDLLPYMRSGLYQDFDMLWGARFHPRSRRMGYSRLKTFGNFIFNFIYSLACDRKIYDMGSGLNLYKTSVLKSKFFQKFPDNLTFNCAMTLTSCYLGHRCFYFPITWREYDQVSNVKLFSQSLETLKLFVKFLSNKKDFLRAEMREHQFENYSASVVTSATEIKFTEQNVVITMAGQGERFKKAGYGKPKYQILALEKSLFEWSMESLRAFISSNNKFIFVVLAKDNAVEFIRSQCASLGILNFEIVELAHGTSGQAESVVAALPFCNLQAPLLIYNIDTFVEPGTLKPESLRGDGFIPCFAGNNPQWSYVKTDAHDRATEVREKTVISDKATVGLYWFRTCEIFKNAYEHYYKNESVWEAGETFVGPIYNQMIAEGKTVYAELIPSEHMHVLGAPENVEAFKKNYQCVTY